MIEVASGRYARNQMWKYDLDSSVELGTTQDSLDGSSDSSVCGGSYGTW